MGGGWKFLAEGSLCSFFIGSFFFSTRGVKPVGRRLCSAGLSQVFGDRAPVRGIQGLPVDSYDGWFGGRMAPIILTPLPKRGAAGEGGFPSAVGFLCLPHCAVPH